MNEFCRIFNIKHPIIQAGMVWVSGAKLAAACANEGIIGTIGAGSMKPDLLEQHIKKAKKLTNPKYHHLLAVNFPLLYGQIEEQLKIALNNNIKIFITSAGSPKKFTKFLKDNNRLVLHVCSSVKEAKKCEEAGVDAIIAEGFEAGGHNGRNETTTLVLIPQVVDNVKIPVIAAGGIACSRQIRAAHALGASGVQIGSRFVMTTESSAHQNFKTAVSDALPGDTKLLMKKYVPVRLLRNQFSEVIKEMEAKGAKKEELVEYLAKGRAKKGMLEGDLINGELEIGQVSGMIKEIQSASNIIKELKKAYLS